MSYGLRLKDADGNVVLAVTDRITRFRYSNEVSGGVSGSVNLSDIEGQDTVQFAFPLEEDPGDAPHLVTRSGTTISWGEPANSGFITWVNSVVYVFFY